MPLPPVSIIAAKALIGRESAAELSQAVQHLTGARQALNPQNIIVADQFDPVTFDEPVKQVFRLSQRYLQAGNQDQPEGRESFNLMTE